MKNPRILLLLILALFVFTLTPADACDKSRCCESVACALKASASALSTGIKATTGALTESIKFTTHAGCEVIRETPHQLAAIPDQVAQGANAAQTASQSFTDSIVSGMQAVARAIITLSSSLLRIIFSSFSGLVSAISPF